MQRPLGGQLTRQVLFTDTHREVLIGIILHIGTERIGFIHGASVSVTRIRYGRQLQHAAMQEIIVLICIKAASIILSPVRQVVIRGYYNVSHRRLSVHVLNLIQVDGNI